MPEFDPGIAEQQALRAGVKALIEGHLDTIWPSIVRLPEGDRLPALIEFAKGIDATYGTVAAEIAADFYNRRRAEVDGLPAYTARPSRTVTTEEIEKAVTRAARNIDSPGADLGATKDAVSVATTGIADRSYTRNFRRNASRDPSKPWWARVPGPEACPWCMMLASNGWVWEGDAPDAGSDIHKFHDGCSCTPTPAWDKKGQRVGGYDPDALAAQYAHYRDIAGSGEPAAIINAWRRDIYRTQQLQEMSTQLTNLGIERVHFGGLPLKVARQITQGLSEVLTVTPELADWIKQVDTVPTFPERPRWVGGYDITDRSLVLVADRLTKPDSLGVLAEHNFHSGDWSTSSPSHLVWHEAGHAYASLHDTNRTALTFSQDRWDEVDRYRADVARSVFGSEDVAAFEADTQARERAREVASFYALADTDEAIAEAYAEYVWTATGGNSELSEFAKRVLGLAEGKP